MAIVRVNLPNLSTKNIRGPEGDASELLPGSFQLDFFNEAIRQVFQGDFDYSSPELVNNSEITGFDIFIDGVLAWSFADILYTVSQYKLLFASEDPGELLFAEVDQIFGSGGDDWLYSFDSDDLVEGASGNDLIDGGQGNDLIFGGFGNDTLYGGSGIDKILGEDGNDLIIGGEGDDFINGNADNDAIFGGFGNDTLYGGRGLDQILGEDGNDLITGGEGDDFINGNADNDAISGGFGNDILYGGRGLDQILGEAGNDLIVGGEGDDFINGNQDNDTIFGGFGNDTLYGGGGLDQILGDAGNDLLIGGEGDDFIDGNADNDAVAGGLGGDDVRGGQGNDVLNGQSGNDFITGGVDADLLTGGAGDDIFFTRPGASPLPTSSTINVGTSGSGSSARFEFGNGVDILTDFDTAVTQDQINYSEQAQPNPFDPVRSPFFVGDLEVGTAYIMSGRWIPTSGGGFNAGDFVYEGGFGVDYLFFVAAEPVNLNDSFPEGPNSAAFIGSQSIVLLNPNVDVFTSFISFVFG